MRTLFASITALQNGPGVLQLINVSSTRFSTGVLATDDDRDATGVLAIVTHAWTHCPRQPLTLQPRGVTG